MNSMDRLGAVLTGEKQDRQMFTATLSMYGAKLISCPLKEYYHDPEKYFLGQQKVVEKIKPDVLFSPFSLPLEASAFGSKIIFFQKNPPNVSRPVLHNADDIDTFTVPKLKTSSPHTYFLDSIRRLAGQYKGTIPIAAPTCSPVDFPILLMGIEGWLDTFLFKRKQAAKLIEILTGYFVEWANIQLQEGADFVVVPVIFSNPDFLTQDLIQKETLQYYKTAFSQINGPIVLHHGGAKMNNFISYFADLPNVAAFVIDYKDGFPEARKEIGERPVLIGNLDGPNLWRFDPDQMKKVCLHKKEQMTGAGKIILGTSNADVAYDTPLETLQALYTFVEEDWRFDG